MMVWAIVGIGALSFVVWAHHMYVSGMHPYFGFFFATTTLIIAVPTAIKVYNWILTLWRGDIHLTVPMLFAIGFIVTLRQWRPDRPVPRQCRRRRSAVRHHVRRRPLPYGDGRRADPGRVRRHLSLVSESHWPHARRPLGKFHFWVTFLGAYAIFFPMHYLGLLGVPRRYHEIGDAAFVPPSAHTLNAFITIAALIVGFAQTRVPVQSDLEPVQGQAGGRQSVARDDARMADAGDAAGAWQLGPGAAGRLSLGV